MQLKRTKEKEICDQVFKEKIQKLHKFFAMERKMNKKFAEKHKLFMSEYETLGHMEPIWENAESGYYTPHHGILSANKFRVVSNASAKTTTGLWLDDTQLVGDKLQRDLVEIFLSFRKYKYGITADIEKMYKQVWIHKGDQKYQKILWRDNDKQPVKVYQLKT